MGWTSYHATHYKNGKVDRKAECDSQFTFGTHKVLKSTMKGRVYYGAIDTGNGNVVGVVCLTSGQDRHDPYYNFSIKVIDETMGPCESECPKSILDLLTPTDSEFANAWRERCRNATKGNWLKSVEIGQRIIWKRWDGTELTLLKHAPAYQFRTWFWYDEANHKYISKKLVTENNSRLKGEKL